jgi:hypothetical protein
MTHAAPFGMDTDAPRYPVHAPPIALDRRKHQYIDVLGDSILSAGYVSIALTVPQEGERSEHLRTDAANGFVRREGPVSAGGNRRPVASMRKNRGKPNA